MSKKEIPTDTEGKLQQLRNDIHSQMCLMTLLRLGLNFHYLYNSNEYHKISLVENKIADAIKHAGLTIQELGKEHMAQKNITNAEKYTSKFLQELDDVETELNRQINYLGQVFMVFLCLLCITYQSLIWFARNEIGYIEWT